MDHIAAMTTVAVTTTTTHNDNGSPTASAMLSSSPIFYLIEKSSLIKWANMHHAPYTLTFAIIYGNFIMTIRYHSHCSIIINAFPCHIQYSFQQDLCVKWWMICHEIRSLAEILSYKLAQIITNNIWLELKVCVQDHELLAELCKWK